MEKLANLIADKIGRFYHPTLNMLYSQQ